MSEAAGVPLGVANDGFFARKLAGVRDGSGWVMPLAQCRLAMLD